MGWLLGKAPLGQGQGGGVGHQADFAAPPYYLLRDEFTTDRAAGAVDGTAAEPGPGERDVVDSGGRASIAGGRFVVANSVASFDPQFIYTGGVRSPGRMVVIEITTANTGNHVSVGWGVGAGSGTNFDHGLRFIQTSIIRINLFDSTAVDVGAFATTTSYLVAVIQRAAGALYFVKGGAYSNWTLLYVESLGTTGPLRTGAFTVGIGRSWSSDEIIVPALKWLPAPVVSDGFSAWGESDGLGHAEGIAGGIGSGGGGVEWTDAAGTWGAADGVAAASALTGGRAIATADSGEADLIATVNCTFSSGTMSLIVRWVDESNHVQLRLTSANCQLVKVVAGVSTTVSDVAYTYVAGAPLRLICSGDKFRRFYNNAAIGAEFTIADAAIQSATMVGLRTDNTGNTFDDLTIYARGTGGEYDTILDAI
jgi:hypothetical protein